MGPSRKPLISQAALNPSLQEFPLGRERKGSRAMFAREPNGGPSARPKRSAAIPAETFADRVEACRSPQRVFDSDLFLARTNSRPVTTSDARRWRTVPNPPIFNLNAY